MLRRDDQVPRVVVDAARVLKQVADLDPVRVLSQEPGQPPIHRVAQTDPPLGDELEHDRGDHRLGDAADAEAVGCSHRGAVSRVAHPALPRPGAGLVFDPRERARRARAHDRVELSL